MARGTGWEPGASPSSRALLVSLPPLTPDDTLHIVGAASQGLDIPPQLPHAMDAHGNPYDKAVPIVELTPDAHARFVRMAWPEGRPPAKECLPPA